MWWWEGPRIEGLAIGKKESGERGCVPGLQGSAGVRHRAHDGQERPGHFALEVRFVLVLVLLE